MALTNTRGIFALSDVRIRQNTGYWSPKYIYGYFGGGTPGSTIYRINYTNDTTIASARANLTPDLRWSTAATGNSYYGYWAGGFVQGGSILSTVSRLDYTNDTATASIRGNLIGPRKEMGATGNIFYGYFAGGQDPSSPTTKSSVNRFNYSNDTDTTSPRGPLTAERTALTATGNSSYGWFGGGDNATPIPTSSVNRIDYTNDTATASPRGSLTPNSGKRFIGSTGNSSYGWFGGGIYSFPGTTIIYSNVDRINYSSDTVTASPRGSLSLARYALAATGNTSYGWFGGGYTPGAPGFIVSTVDRIDYSNDTVSAPARGPLTAARYLLSATSASFIEAGQVAEIPAQVFPYGYFGGGNATPGTISSIYRIDYNNDTVAGSPRGSLSLTLDSSAATGNSAYGYFAGGNSPSATPNVISSVNRIDYSNDTATASVRGPLSAARQNSLAATGNSSYGWYGGGGFPADSPSIISRKVDRIDYSNDTATSSPRGNLSTISRRLLTATGNSTYGYFAGGLDTGTTTYDIVDRIDYSNDTANASPKGVLNTGKTALASTGNSNYGWFGGGVRSNASPSLDTFFNAVDRIDYANDTTTSSPRGNLTLARAYLAATGNKSYGWFGGGLTATPATVSTVDRIDYSNDTATASPRGNLGIANQRLSSTSQTINGFPQ